jgi:hypothetical protein
MMKGVNTEKTAKRPIAPWQLFSLRYRELCVGGSGASNSHHASGNVYSNDVKYVFTQDPQPMTRPTTDFENTPDEFRTDEGPHRPFDA